MTTKADDPAFSRTKIHYTGPNGVYSNYVDGLTKREYFAACALQGMLSDSARSGDPSPFAEAAVEHADVLIAALNEK